jgi:hypothetical protein
MPGEFDSQVAASPSPNKSAKKKKGKKKKVGGTKWGDELEDDDTLALTLQKEPNNK